MRGVTLLPALILVAGVTACGGSDLRAASTGADAVPAAVNCGDAAQLTQRAADDRKRVDESRSDQERIVAGSRANFLASLAVIATLKCRGAAAGADDGLKAALAAAHNATTTNSVYEKTRAYQEANFLATRLIETMTTSAPTAPK